jgi:hypothetical protein
MKSLHKSKSMLSAVLVLAVVSCISLLPVTARAETKTYGIQNAGALVELGKDDTAIFSFDVNGLGEDWRLVGSPPPAVEFTTDIESAGNSWRDRGYQPGVPGWRWFQFKFVGETPTGFVRPHFLLLIQFQKYEGETPVGNPISFPYRPKFNSTNS